MSSFVNVMNIYITVSRCQVFLGRSSIPNAAAIEAAGLSPRRKQGLKSRPARRMDPRFPRG
jgi:hypothetical protein